LWVKGGAQKISTFQKSRDALYCCFSRICVERVVGHIEELLQTDIRTNEDIGDHGAAALLSDALGKGDSRLNVLTHCNTGSLATAGYGTALGVIRSLHKRGKLGKSSDLNHEFVLEVSFSASYVKPNQARRQAMNLTKANLTYCSPSNITLAS